MWQTQDSNWMKRNFAISWPNINRGRYWTLITSSFSHQEIFHLFSNMFTLYFLGSTVLQLIGPVQFAMLYLAGRRRRYLGTQPHLQSHFLPTHKQVQSAAAPFTFTLRTENGTHPHLEPVGQYWPLTQFLL